MNEKKLPTISNVATPFPRIITGGRPAFEHFAALKALGVTTVVNLCPPGEACTYDEAALMRQLGMRYVNIPVAGPGDLTADSARSLHEAIDVDGEVLVHCASSNRVGALFALKARHVDGKNVEESLAIGWAAGLKAMEPVVRQLLEKAS
ncbi:MAG: beta-lactamase hydrolase domain-containing protein [Stenotrophobium sp.]